MERKGSSVIEVKPMDPLENLVTGYPKLAGQMEILPEIAIFRRFGALNARRLLYLQAELIQLENDLVRVEAADKKCVRGRRDRFSRDWFWLNESLRSNDPNDYNQRQLVETINTKLKEYSMVLRVRKDRTSNWLDNSREPN